MGAIFLFLGLGFTSLTFALPGFVEPLKRLHPEKAATCWSCHQAKDPGADNVSDDGRRFYREILAATPLPPLRERRIGSGDSTAVEFGFYGDSRDNPKVHSAIVADYCKRPPKAVFHAGDMVHDGAVASQWDLALGEIDCVVKKQIFYPVCGNHEGNYCTRNVVRKALHNDQYFYSVPVGGFTFLMLDSIHITESEEKWLAGLPAGKYIPVFHYPAYPTLSGHAGDSGVIEKFLPQFKRLKIKLVLTGHNHGYDRALVDGVTYVTSGGGGAPLYPCGPSRAYSQACTSDYHSLRCEIRGTAIDCETHLLDGKVIDSFHVEAG